MTMENLAERPCLGDIVTLPNGDTTHITEVIRYKGDGKFDCVVRYLDGGRNAVVFKKDNEWHAITHHKHIYK